MEIINWILLDYRLLLLAVAPQAIWSWILTLRSQGRGSFLPCCSKLEQITKKGTWSTCTGWLHFELRCNLMGVIESFRKLSFWSIEDPFCTHKFAEHHAVTGSWERLQKVTEAHKLLTYFINCWLIYPWSWNGCVTLSRQARTKRFCDWVHDQTITRKQIYFFPSQNSDFWFISSTKHWESLPMKIPHGDKNICVFLYPISSKSIRL